MFPLPSSKRSSSSPTTDLEHEDAREDDEVHRAGGELAAQLAEHPRAAEPPDDADGAKDAEEAKDAEPGRAAEQVEDAPATAEVVAFRRCRCLQTSMLHICSTW